MTLQEIGCTLEAILFAAGESVPESKLCAVLGIDKPLLTEVARELSDYYDFNRRGIRLLQLEDKLQLCSRSDYAPLVREALETRRQPSLSASALETLVIVAYKQPVTKVQIEQIRGVDSSYTIGSLAEKGLIAESGRLNVPGRPILYSTTEGFLRAFGLSSLDQLPPMQMPGDGAEDQLTLAMAGEEA